MPHAFESRTNVLLGAHNWQLCLELANLGGRAQHFDKYIYAELPIVCAKVHIGATFNGMWRFLIHYFTT